MNDILPSEPTRLPSDEQLLKVRNHPLVRRFDPADLDYVEVVWLSSRLNPFDRYGFKMGAAITFKNLPHIKAPVAFNMLMGSFMAGRLEGIHTLFEASSGNTGHGLARLAGAFGIQRVVLILPGDITGHKRELLAALGASTLQNNDPSMNTIQYADHLARMTPGSIHINQYTSDLNWRTHYNWTGPKLQKAAGRHLDVVAVPLGSCGQGKGLTRYFGEKFPNTIVVGAMCADGNNNGTPGARNKSSILSTGSGWLKEIAVVHSVNRHDSFVEMKNLFEEVEPQPGPTSGMAKAGLEQFLESRLHSHGPEWFQGKSGVFLCDDDGRMYPERQTGELDTTELAPRTSALTPPWHSSNAR